MMDGLDPKDAPMRAVVSQVEVPYDYEADGVTPVTYTADVLECGHRRKCREVIFFADREASKDTIRRYKNRRCYACQKEGRIEISIGCCEACSGRGTGCPDCLGTGHPHADPENCP